LAAAAPAGGCPLAGVGATVAGWEPVPLGAPLACGAGTAAPCWVAAWSGDPAAGKLRLRLSPNGVPVQPVCSKIKTMAAAKVAGARQGLGISCLRA